MLSQLFGKFESREEVKKFGLLGIIFGLIIGAYWAMRPIKDSIFFSMVGVNYQPVAKWISLLIVSTLVIIYSKLIDTFPRHKVFYALTLMYGVIALVFAWYFFDPVHGLPNTTEDPSRILGWAWYCYVESFGSLIVALFWAISTDTTMPEVAKRGFPLIALFGQFGNIFGPWLLRAERWGWSNSAPIVLILGFIMLSMCIMMFVFMKVVPKSQLVGYHGTNDAKETEPGFLEGLKLLITKSYLLGIFAIITIYEIIVTIFDYHFKAEAKAVYAAEKDLANYLADYAVWTGIIAFLCVLFGINSIQRRLGMKYSLLMMPLLVAVAVITLKFNPSLSVAFWIMVISKAVNYALNQPTIKQVYIPTTKDTKYKATAWLEMFGSRGAKAGGSAINAFRGVFKSQYGALAGVSWFLTISTAASMGMIVVWLFAALFVAKTYNKAIAENKVVC